MSNKASEKYYWLKLKRDFFKRHDIQIIENQKNGKDYILFYLKLLCEAIDHNGELRFNETIPYNEEMLSVITNTNIDVVKSAIQIFVSLNMMEIYDNGTIFMKETQKMLGSETYWAEKKRLKRQQENEVKNLEEIEQKDSEIIGHCPTDVQSLSPSCPICPSKNKSKRKNKRKIYIDKSDKSNLNVAKNALNKLFECEYLNEFDLDVEDYENYFEELLLEVSPKDFNVKLSYFISTVCDYVKSQELDKNGNPLFEYRYTREDIQNRFIYLKISLDKIFKRQG